MKNLNFLSKFIKPTIICSSVSFSCGIIYELVDSYFKKVRAQEDVSSAIQVDEDRNYICPVEEEYHEVTSTYAYEYDAENENHRQKMEVLNSIIDEDDDEPEDAPMSYYEKEINIINQIRAEYEHPTDDKDEEDEDLEGEYFNAQDEIYDDPIDTDTYTISDDELDNEDNSEDMEELKDIVDKNTFPYPIIISDDDIPTSPYEMDLLYYYGKNAILVNEEEKRISNPYEFIGSSLNTLIRNFTFDGENYILVRNNSKHKDYKIMYFDDYFDPEGLLT